MAAQSLGNPFEGRPEERVVEKCHEGALRQREPGRILNADLHLDSRVPGAQGPEVAIAGGCQIPRDLHTDQAPETGQHPDRQTTPLAAAEIDEGRSGPRGLGNAAQDLQGQPGIHPLVLDGIRETESGIGRRSPDLPGEQRPESMPTVEGPLGEQITETGPEPALARCDEDHPGVLDQEARPVSVTSDAHSPDLASSVRLHGFDGVTFGRLWPRPVAAAGVRWLASL